MSEYYFSPSRNEFYPAAWVERYIEAGNFPDDATVIDNEIAEAFTKEPPVGKVRGVVDGMPAWVDVPPPTHEELVAIAEQKKKALLADAVAVTSMWRTELQLGIISDDDKAALTAWILYHRALQDIDTDTAPDIEWPMPPDVQES